MRRSAEVTQFLVACPFSSQPSTEHAGSQHGHSVRSCPGLTEPRGTCVHACLPFSLHSFHSCSQTFTNSYKEAKHSVTQPLMDIIKLPLFPSSLLSLPRAVQIWSFGSWFEPLFQEGGEGSEARPIHRTTLNHLGRVFLHRTLQKIVLRGYF